MRAAEIETLDDLEVWLKDQPIEVSVWIAYRMAARTLPAFWLNASEKGLPIMSGEYVLPIVRSALISGERTIDASTEICEAAAFATASASGYYVPKRIADAIMSAADSLNAVDAALAAATLSDAPGVASSLCVADAAYVEENGRALAVRLWLNGCPNEIAEAWSRVPSIVPAPDRLPTDEFASRRGEPAPDYNSFWIPWYQGLLDGSEAFSPGLRRDIALIPPDEWDKGDVHINNVVIPRLMAEHAKRDAIRGERIERTPTGELTSVAITELPEEIRARAKSRVLEALDDLRHMGHGGNQIYGVFTPYLDVIERGVERSRNDSVRLFETLEDATHRIQGVARENGLADDPEVRVALANIDRSRMELWNGDPVVRDAETAPPLRSIEDLSDDEKQVVKAYGEAIESEADASLAIDVRADLQTVFADYHASPRETRRALWRLASRSIQYINILDTEDDTPLAKGLKNFVTYGTAIQILWSIVRIVAP